ncbi:hypothetical protein KAH37_03395 [bacterium]|nr:hypothetical protein [bacterium]
MRYKLIFILFIILMSSCSSCNSGQKIDGDSDKNQSVDDFVDETDVEQSETVDEQFDDIAQQPDEETTDDYCPSLKEAPFPYEEESGQKHFCRPCDTPTENDPHCVINLMQDLQDRVGSSDCWPYPCKWDSISPMKQGDPSDPDYLHECDLKVSVNGGAWSINGVNRKQFTLQDGIVQIGLTGSILHNMANRWVKYYIKDGYYEVVASPAGGAGGMYTHDITILDLYELSPQGQAEKGYLLAIENKNGIPFYRIIYTVKTDILHQVYQPAIGPEYVAINVEFYSDNPEEMEPAKVLVAKRGEWKWKKIAEGEAKIVMADHYLSVQIDPLNNKDSYLCDLEKEINNIEKDCIKINKEGEYGNYTVFDDNNPKRMVYTSDLQTLTLREEKDGVITYTHLDIPPVEDGIYDSLLAAEQLKGNLLLYGENRAVNQGIWSKRQLCQINIKTKERVCIPFGINEWTENPRQGYSMWEGDYVVWQTSGSTIATLRDMKCYCEKEGVCLLKE